MTAFQYNHELYLVVTIDDNADTVLAGELKPLIKNLADHAEPNNKNISLAIEAIDNPYPTDYSDNADKLPSTTFGKVTITSDVDRLPLSLVMDIVVREGKQRNVNIDYDWQLQAVDLDGFDIAADSACDIVENLDRDFYTDVWFIDNENAIDDRLEDMRLLALEVFERVGRAVGLGFRKIHQKKKPVLQHFSLSA